MIKYIRECRYCGNPNLVEVLDLGYQTIQGSFVYTDKSVPPNRSIHSKILRCDITKQTDACGLIQTNACLDPNLLYSNYSYQSSINSSMVQHLKNIAENVESLYKSKNIKKEPFDISYKVLDIGSNDNTFLNCFGNEWTKVGVDPSDVAEESKQKNVELYNECFPSHNLIEKYRNNKFNIVCSLSCLYDIQNIELFLGNLRKILIDGGIYLFEVAYLISVLQRVAYEQFCWEDVSTFSLNTLEYIFRDQGLKIFNAYKTETNNGSIICFATHADCSVYDTKKFQANLIKLRIEEFDLALDTDKPYKEFRDKVEKHGNLLVELLNGLKHRKESIYILGASTKLNVVLNRKNLGLQYFDGAVDRDPRKVGAKTISGIPIISEEDGRKKATIYFCGPTHFKKEILIREQEFLDKGGKIVFPSWPITIVSKDGEEKVE